MPRVQWVNHLVPPATPLRAAPCSPRGTKRNVFLPTDSAQPSLDPMMVCSFYWAACARFFLHAGVAVAQYRMRKKEKTVIGASSRHLPSAHDPPKKQRDQGKVKSACSCFLGFPPPLGNPLAYSYFVLWFQAKMPHLQQVLFPRKLTICRGQQITLAPRHYRA